MDRFQPISLTNSSLGAHLYPSEEVLLLTANVGLYSGPNKSLPHSSGVVYLTTHRIFYVDDALPHSHSCYLPLNLIRESQYYAGFLKSSPKVTLGFEKVEKGEYGKITNAIDGHINAGSFSTNGTRMSKKPSKPDWREGTTLPSEETPPLQSSSSRSWICRICAFSNSVEGQGITPESTVKCQLCGVSSKLKDVKVDEPKSSTNGKNIPTLMKSNEGISCPACTFSNHPSMARCEICDTPLGTVDPATLRGPTEAGIEAVGSGAQTPVNKEDDFERHDSVRLSFRKGGDKAFYSTLKSTLLEKQWQKSTAQRSNPSSRSQNRFSSLHRNIDGRSAASALQDDHMNGTTDGTSSRRVGIEGILSAVDLQAREESDDMRDAFRDLEALMTRAKKMVDLAETLNAKLTRREAASKSAGVEGGQGVDLDNDEAANVIRSSLVRLGLPTPAITSDMAKDEMEFNMQLALELAGLLYSGRQPLMGHGTVRPRFNSADSSGREQPPDGKVTGPPSSRGILPLDELWCMWNRARGIALVSPKTLLAVCDIIPTITVPPINCKTFRSGIRVLHLSRYHIPHFSNRVLAYLSEKRSVEEDAAAAAATQSVAKDSSLDDRKDKPAMTRYRTGVTTLEIAKQEDCPLHLISELLDEVEYTIGSIVQDDNGQITWHENLIIQFEWDKWKASLQ